jgi:hypothetical protein
VRESFGSQFGCEIMCRKGPLLNYRNRLTGYGVCESSSNSLGVYECIGGQFGSVGVYQVTVWLCGRGNSLGVGGHCVTVDMCVHVCV